MPRLRLKWVILAMLLLVAAWVFLRTGAMRHLGKDRVHRQEAPLAPVPTALRPESTQTRPPEVAGQATKRVPPIAGDVYDEPTGAPISGALVELLAEAPSDLGDARPALDVPALKSTESDAKGKYSLDAAPGRYFLRASAPGYPRRQNNVFSVAASALRPFRRIPLRKTGALDVSTVDESGKPLPGVTVEIRSSTSPWSFSAVAKSGVDGHASLDVPWDAGLWALGRTPSGLEVVMRKILVSAGSHKSIELRLARGVEVHGRVLDDQGQPLSGVKVVAVASERIAAPKAGVSTQGSCRTLSGVDGTFALSVPDSSQKVNFHLAGYTREELTVEKPSKSGPLEVVLAPGAAISGRVMDAASMPLSGARISREEGEELSIAGRDGRYSLVVQNPKSGNVNLLAKADGYLSLRRNLDELQAREARADIDFQMSAAPLVRGVVVDDLSQTRIPGAEVSFRTGMGDDATVADARGHFELFGQALSGRLAVTAPGFEEEVRPLTIPSAATSDELKFLLKRVSIISGHVYTSDKKPVSGATVELLPGNPRVAASARSGEDGAYVLDSLASTPESIIRARHPELGTGLKTGPQLLPGIRVNGFDIVIEKDGVVAGVVVNEKGEGLADWSVSLRPPFSDIGDIHRTVLLSPHSATTGSEGEFGFSGLLPGDFVATVQTGKGYLGGQKTVRVLPGKTTEVRIELQQSQEIRGRVTDESGNPVPGVALSVTPARYKLGRMRMFDNERATQSGDDGTYRIDGLWPEAYQVNASLSQRQWSATREIRPPAEGVDFVVAASAMLEGRVFSAKTGKPVPEFWVQVGEADSATPELRRRLPSGSASNSFASEDGLFRFESLAAGLYDLTVTARGFAPGLLRGIRLENGKAIRDVRVALWPGASIAGIVLDEDGVGASRVRVGVLKSTDARNTFQPMGDLGADTMTDARGGFRIEGLAAGVINLAARPEASLPTYLRLELRDGEQKEGVEVRLQRGNAVRGTVIWRESGEPAWGANVSVADGSTDLMSLMMPRGGAEVDAQGQFILNGVPMGRVTLNVRKPKSREVVMKPIDVSGDVTEVEIELDRFSGSIVGRVVGEDGKPVDQAFVVNRGGELRFITATTNESGEFRFDGLGTAVYRLTARIDTESGDRSVIREVEVKDGAETAVTLQPGSEEGATLFGRVHRGDGGSVVGLQLMLTLAEESVNSRWGRWNRVTSDLGKDGSYRLTKLPPERYLVFVHPGQSETNCGAGDNVKVEVVMKGHDQRQDIEIPPSATISGIVRTADGAPAPGSTVSLWSGTRWAACRAQTDQDGRYVLTGVSPGEQQLAVSSEGFAETTAEVKVPTGGEVHQDFELRSSGTLTGRVIDPNGEALPKAWLEIRRGSGPPIRSVQLIPDDAGRFEVLGLGAAEYQLTARAVGYAPLTVGPVRAGGELSPEVNFTLTHGGTIRVSVSGKAGAVLAGQSVAIQQVFQGETWELDRLVQTDENGTAEIQLLEPGAYRIRLQTLSGPNEPVEVVVQDGRVSEAQLSSTP